MLQKWVTNAFFPETILYQFFIPKGGRIYNKSNKVTHRSYDMQIIDVLIHLIGGALCGGLLGHLEGTL